MLCWTITLSIMHFGFKFKWEFERCKNYRNCIHIFIIDTSHFQLLDLQPFPHYIWFLIQLESCMPPLNVETNSNVQGNSPHHDSERFSRIQKGLALKQMLTKDLSKADNTNPLMLKLVKGSYCFLSLYSTTTFIFSSGPISIPEKD